MDTTLPKQPADNKELLKRAIRLYRASFSKVIILSFLLSITVFIPRFLSDIIGQEIFLNLPLLSPYRLWIIAVNIISFMFFIGILWRMHCQMRRKHEPLIDDIKMGIRKVFYVIIATFLQSLMVFAVVMLFVAAIMLVHQQHFLIQHPLDIFLIGCLLIAQFLLILYISILFIFTTPLIATESKNIFTAIETSVALAWNHWRRIFTLQITPWIFYFVLLFVIRFVLNVNIHIYFLDQRPHHLWTSLFHLMIFALFIPSVAALLLVQLRDLELRKKLHRR